MSYNKIIDYLNSQLAGATGIHTEALGAVQEYRDFYDGYTGLASIQGRSEAVTKDVMRTVEGSIPSLVDPFLGKDICVIDSQNAESEEAAEVHQDLINYQWNKKNNPLETTELLARNLMVDGTVWVKVGWSPEGYATMEAVPFESVIPDPSAYKIEDMKWVIYRRKVTVSDILNNPVWFGKHTLESLQPLMPSNDTTYEPDAEMGRDYNYDSGQRALDEIEVFEYYGQYDRNGNGKTEPIVAVWSQNVLLNEFDSPYGEFLPFDNTVYIKQPFSIYGQGMGGLIGHMQTQRSALLRGIYDNMAASNNGTKFIRKGSLDPINHRRLMNHEPVVELNVPSQSSPGDMISDGNFNALPPDVYKMMDDLEVEQENLSGITKYAVGSDSRSLNQTATGVSIISSMSQRRLVFIAQHISGLLGRVFKKWMKMNALLLDLPPVDNLDVYVSAGTAGLVEKKNNDIISMMQAISNMPTGVDPAIMNSLVEELASNMGLDSTSKMIKESAKQGPSPQQQQMQEMTMQIQLEAENAKIQKDKAIANKDNAIARKHTVDAAITSVGG